MRTVFTKKKIIGLLLSCFSIASVQGQDLLGLGTGNYSGIAGMTLNPASIVDSRFKFDINLFGLSNYYTNNYILLKRDAFVSGDFFKNRYNSYEAFKKDVLEVNSGLEPGERVYARVNNRIQLPLSFMLTTGRKSAIALNITNRTNIMVNNLNPEFAQLAFDRFRNPSLYNRDFNMDGANVGVLNWVDVGFTYGRVLLDGNKHFLKAAVTAKYIGGAASGYLKADKLNLRFSDSSTFSAQSPYVSYGHSDKVDENLFRSGNINALKNVSSSLGMDLGVVYEYRGRIDKFRYLSPEFETKTRRDQNKYVFRLGASLMDVGRLKFNKGGYNNDFSANINNYDVSGLSIRSAQDLDTALAGHVVYNNDLKSYTVALPTALGLQADLHLFKGFYINASTYQPLEMLKADQRMEVTASYAVTPRFESRVVGVYIPVSYNKLDKWNVGATLRVGPVYVGSSNLGSLVVNQKTRTADIHAGARIPIAFGKKTKVAKFFDGIVKDEKPVEVAAAKETRVTTTTIVTNDTQLNALRNRIAELERRNAQQKPAVVTDERDLEIRELRRRIYEIENRPAYQKPAVEGSAGQPINIIVNNFGSGNNTATSVTDTVKANATNTIAMETMRRELADARAEIVRLKSMQRGDTTQYARELQQKTAEVEYLTRKINEREQQLKDMQERLRLLEEQNTELKKKGIVADSNSTGYKGNSPVTPAVAAQSNAQLEQQIAQLKEEIRAQGATTANKGGNPVPPAELAQNNAQLEQQIALLREEVRAAVRSNNNSGVNDRPVLIPTPVPPVIVNSPNPVQQAAANTVPDTVVRYIHDTVRIQADTVRITDAVEKQIDRVVIQDHTQQKLQAMKLERVLFDVGKSNVKPIYFKGLNFAAKQLKEYPGLKIRVSGHTDKTGNPQINQRLSAARANAVKQYLISKGAQTEQIVIEHFGADEPVVKNNTVSGKLINRRVALSFF